MSPWYYSKSHSSVGRQAGRSTRYYVRPSLCQMPNLWRVICPLYFLVHFAFLFLYLCEMGTVELIWRSAADLFAYLCKACRNVAGFGAFFPIFTPLLSCFHPHPPRGLFSFFRFLFTDSRPFLSFSTQYVETPSLRPKRNSRERKKIILR
jgi:hypothetical protein